MRLLIMYMLIIGLMLTGMSAVYNATPLVYTKADTEFANQYAAEMLQVMEKMAAEGNHLDQRGKPTRCDFFLDGQDQFYRLKYAAVHYKREIAEDFVYAFSMAEDWCRYAARAAYDSADERARQMAELRFRRAYAEFQNISKKDYQHSISRR